MWLNFVLGETKRFLPPEMQENYVSCLVSLSNWKFLGFPSSPAHHSPSFPHADQKSRRIDNRCWYWFQKFNKKRCAWNFHLCFKTRRNKTKTVFSRKFYSYVTVSSGVVNVDTNGVIKILLIKNYDAVFEVCLNFMSNWLLIAIEFDEIAGGDVSWINKCADFFFECYTSDTKQKSR